MAIDWYEIKFLESASNVRMLLGKSAQKQPSARIARKVAVCVQQGRLFFESAAAAPLQIKPLLVYYGVVAFAQAITVARECRSLSTLVHAHGLSDITAATAKVEDLRVRIEDSDTFHEFNDALAPLGRIFYYDAQESPHFI